MDAAPSSQTPGLLLRGLRSRHGGPFDLGVEPGCCITIQGPSGSGKSVLLRLIADLDPSQGEVWLDGRARQQWTGPQWRRQVVYQAAEPAWWAATAAQHFRPEDQAALAAWLPRLGLPEASLGTEIDRLSTGERQRMALLRSLFNQPRVLLLDEPTAALDPETTLAVEALLRERLAEGLALVWVTHSQEQSLRVATRRFTVRERCLQPL